MFFWLIFIVIVLVLYRLNKLITKKKPLVLTKDSVVVLTGGCDGIGRLTAIQLAKHYQSKLVILDIQSKKFADLTK